MTTLNLSEKTLPIFRPHEWDTTSAQLSLYFCKLLEKHLEANTIHQIQLPSILELARILNCCELDVFDALSALKRQAYAYELHGIDAPVKLYDPLFRKPTHLKKPSRFKWLKKWHRKKEMFMPTSYVG